jgi:hypothetical protein
MQNTLLQPLDNQSLDGLKFCSLVYEIFEKVRETPAGIEAIRMRRGKCKKLVEELLPICKYMQAKYRPGRYISVKWRDGSQTYDAELRSTGAYVTHGHYPESSFLEVTCVVHPNDYLAREHLNAGGAVFGLVGLARAKDRTVISIPHAHVGEIFIDDYADLVLAELAKKAIKPYPDGTALVMQCCLNRLYIPSDWAKLESTLRARIPQHPFTELFLYDPISEYSASI